MAPVACKGGNGLLLSLRQKLNPQKIRRLIDSSHSLSKTPNEETVNGFRQCDSSTIEGCTVQDEFAASRRDDSAAS
jgi:hypothetical protein